MKRKDIIFTQLLERLEHFTANGANTENYHSDLTSEERKNSFMGLMEQVEHQISEVIKDKNENRLPSDLGSLSLSIESLANDFNDFPEARFSEVLTMIYIIGKIKEVADEEDFNIMNEVNTEIFILYEINNLIHKKYFFSHDYYTPENSIFLISLQSISHFKEFISFESVPAELLLQLLAKLGTDQILDVSKQYLLIKTIIPDKAKEACIKLHLVKAGHFFHIPQAYTGSLNIHPSRKIIPERRYQQFQDTLLIISEYNYQKDILDKYLRLYHVVENFMFRTSLVKLERNNEGTPFSIRDFQRLYKQVNTSELDALKSLIDQALNKEYDSTPLTFRQYFLNQWRSLPSGSLTVTQITKLMSFLSVTPKKGYTEVTEQNFHSVISQFVYYYRNAIVHNKDTELHLTHETLTRHPVLKDTAQKFLETFLIPCIEEIVFYLLIEDNDIVRFNHSSLKLWEDEA